MPEAKLLSVRDTLLPLDTWQMFWISLPIISQLHHYHGRWLWCQCCCNLSPCPVFCTLGIKYLCIQLVTSQYNHSSCNSPWLFYLKEILQIFFNSGISLPMSSNIFIIKALSRILLLSLWILIQTSYNVSTTLPIKNIPQLHSPSSCVLAVNHKMGIQII